MRSRQVAGSPCASPGRLLALTLGAALVGGACGGGAASVRAGAKGAEVAEAAGPPAYRARIVVSLDTWTDVEARGTDDAARSACAGALAESVDFQRRAGLSARVARGCSVEPLPPPPRRHVPGVRLVVVDSGRRGVRLTDVTRLASFDECEPVRRRLAARRADHASRGEDGAQTWLTDERARAVAERDAACAPPAGPSCSSAEVRVKAIDDKLAEVAAEGAMGTGSPAVQCVPER